MTIKEMSCDELSDRELLNAVRTRARAERQCMAALVAALMELDARKLYLGEGCSSLFTYCTQVLQLSEHAAYGRIEAARAARRFPPILQLLADASITLTTVCLLGPVLTAENHRAILEAAKHKSKRDVEHLVAALRPRPDAVSLVRKLPAPRPCAAAPATLLPVESRGSGQASASPAPPVVVTASSSRPADVRPTAPERYKVQLTVDRETYEKLRRAQDLLRHRFPTGDPAAIFDRALTLLVADLERRTLAATARPRVTLRAGAHSRYVSAAVRREVWQRDGGRCAFVGPHGRCRETGFLELHHLVPFAAGGPTTAANLALRCRAHNQHEAERFFGRAQSVATRRRGSLSIGDP